MVSPNEIFDARQGRLRQHRARAQGAVDFLLERVVDDMAERLLAVQRRFSSVADVGTPSPRLAERLRLAYPEAWVTHLSSAPIPVGVRADPERLPLAEGSLDLATSALALQTANDLPGALIQIRRALKPDGLFLGALFGGRTLIELRSVLTQAETEVLGGVSPRVAPFADVRDMGGLLQRAGFALPVADSDVVTVRYDDLFALVRDLRGMAATNILVARSRATPPRALFLRAAELYAARFADPDGRIRATFETVAISGWAPHESQAKPARRGSATVSLAEVLKDRSAPQR